MKKLKVAARPEAAASVTAWFSEDVSASIGPDDLLLVAADGTRVDPSTMSVTYDAARHAATWTFPAFLGARPNAGKYNLNLSASGVTDAAGQLLDGNRDGTPADDFILRKPWTIR